MRIRFFLSLLVVIAVGVGFLGISTASAREAASALPKNAEMMLGNAKACNTVIPDCPIPGFFKLASFHIDNSTSNKQLMIFSSCSTEPSVFMMAMVPLASPTYESVLPILLMVAKNPDKYHVRPISFAGSNNNLCYLTVLPKS